MPSSLRAIRLRASPVTRAARSGRRWGGPLACVAVLAAAAGALVLAAARPAAAQPTPSPTPTVSGVLERLTIASESTTRTQGEFVNYVVTGHFTAGTRNLTQRCIYSSSDLTVAYPPNADGNRGRVEAVGPGVATIAATDEITGISTTQTDADATLTVRGPLQKITLKPATATRVVGTVQNYVATGTYGDGSEQNITQKVDFASSDPAVASAPSQPPNRGAVTMVAPGTAVISATDPVSGIRSTASGGDATVTVLGELESISLKPLTAQRSVGETQNYVATGHYAGGGTQNITQKVDFASSDPAVAAAPNQPPNKGAVTMTAPGTAQISATDPVTGIASTAGGGDATVTVLGPLERLEITPAELTTAIGKTPTFSVKGFFEGGGEKNLTQAVTYASSDPAVLEAPNEEGNRSRMRAVAVGTATVTATDPATSLESAGAVVTVLEAAAPTPTGGPTPAPLCGDADANGAIAVTDGVRVLRAASGLAGDCVPSRCDVDGSGSLGVTDGVLVLRAAAGLPAELGCGE